MTFVDFCKRVGIVCTAILGVATIVGWLWASAITAALRPVTAAIADERTSRLVGQLDLIDVLSAPIGPERDGKIAGIRTRLEHEQERGK